MKHFLITSVVMALPIGAAEPLAFNRDIRPILSKTCFTCYGPDAAAVKSELRLDLRERALKGSESGKPAITRTRHPPPPQRCPTNATIFAFRANCPIQYRKGVSYTHGAALLVYDTSI